LAFFILEAFLAPLSLNAQDAKTLENGLRVIIEEDHRNPIVVFSVFIDSGAAYEGVYLGSGISHLVEHMLFKGTKKYHPGAIEDILHKYGGKIAGFTSHDYTGYRITILKEHKDVAIDILKEMLTRPIFNKKELKKEMQVIEREMDLNKDDPGRRLSRMTFSNAYSRHPYNLPVIGYKENFRRLRRKDLLIFFKSSYIPEKMVLAVVGDIDKNSIFNEIENALGSLPRGGSKVTTLPQEPEQMAARYTEEALDIEGSYVNIAYHSSELLNKDLYPMDLLSFILGQGESSILNDKLRMKKELVLSISSYNYTPRDSGLFVISSVLKEENAKEALEEILKEIKDIKENGVTEKDLVKAKNNFLAGHIYQKETIRSKASDLAIGELLTGNPLFFEEYIEKIKSVTAKDIQLSAKKYLRKENMTVAILSKSGKILKPDSKKDLTLKKRKINKITLKNGLVVLVSSDPHLPIVSSSLVFKGGLRLETKENNGISKITSFMLMDGTDSKSREDLALSYESKGISLGTYSGNNSIGISGECLKEHAEYTLKLISEVCMDSNFPENEVEREKDELLTIIDMQDNSITNHGQRLLKKLLFKRHPYRFQGIGTRESISKIKREDIVKFYDDMLFGKNMVLGISGDCDIDEIKTLVEKYFSKLPSNKKTLPIPKKELPMDSLRKSLVKVPKEQSLMLVGFHGISIYDKDLFAVEVMMDIISTESGVLFKNIREKSGLSYAVGASEVLGLDPGYIVLYTLTSKGNLKSVKDILFKEMNKFIKNGPTDEDLRKSKNHLKATQKMSLETNSGFIFKASLDELYGLGYNNYKNYDKNITRVTKEDVKKAAERLLTLNKCAILTLEGK